MCHNLDMLVVGVSIDYRYIANLFIDKSSSNDFTEGLNNKIKVIKKVGFRYKKIELFRLRSLYI